MVREVTVYFKQDGKGEVIDRVVFQPPHPTRQLPAAASSPPPTSSPSILVPPNNTSSNALSSASAARRDQTENTETYQSLHPVLQQSTFTSNTKTTAAVLLPSGNFVGESCRDGKKAQRPAEIEQERPRWSISTHQQQEHYYDYNMTNNHQDRSGPQEAAEDSNHNNTSKKSASRNEEEMGDDKYSRLPKKKRRVVGSSLFHWQEQTSQLNNDNYHLLENDSKSSSSRISANTVPLVKTMRSIISAGDADGGTYSPTYDNHQNQHHQEHLMMIKRGQRKTKKRGKKKMESCCETKSWSGQVCNRCKTYSPNHINNIINTYKSARQPKIQNHYTILMESRRGDLWTGKPPIEKQCSELFLDIQSLLPGYRQISDHLIDHMLDLGSDYGLLYPFPLKFNRPPEEIMNKIKCKDVYVHNKWARVEARRHERCKKQVEMLTNGIDIENNFGIDSERVHSAQTIFKKTSAKTYIDNSNFTENRNNDDSSATDFLAKPDSKYAKKCGERCIKCRKRFAFGGVVVDAMSNLCQIHMQKFFCSKHVQLPTGYNMLETEHISAMLQNGREFGLTFPITTKLNHCTRNSI